MDGNSISGPGEGMGQALLYCVVFIGIWGFALLVVFAKSFRLTMKHPQQKPGGRLYKMAVGIVFAVGLLLSVAWVDRQLYFLLGR